MSRPRVLTVISTLGRGGAEQQLVTLVRATAQDLEHVVVHLAGPDDLAADLVAAGARVVDLGLRSSRRWPAGVLRLARVLRRERPDVVKTDLFDANLVAVLARLIAGRPPVLTTLHNLDYEPETIRAASLPRRRMEVLRRIDRALVHAGTRYVACSQAVADSAVRHVGVPPERLEVIYNSVDLDRFDVRPGDAAAVRRELGIPEDAVVIVDVARLDPQKAQDVLIDAFDRVASDDAGVHLVLVGAGPTEGALRAAAQRSAAAARIHLVGRRPDVHAVLAASDVFALPSWFEGFPVALVEAMAAGLPIVASNIAPNREATADTSVLVAPGDVDALAGALAALVADADQRRALGAAARARVACFRTDVVAEQWRDLVRAAVA